MLRTELLTRYRKREGITQAEAARRAGLPFRQSWSAIESGRSANVRLTTLYRIAKVMGCRPGTLLTAE